MKLFWNILLMLVFSCSLSAQIDSQAKEVLDKTSVEIINNMGIRFDFIGNGNGYMLLKGEKFYLNSEEMQSWYDGKTLWSYVAETEEVNVSIPTIEELQGMNPYFILNNYKNHFKYFYKGFQMKNGKKGHEIILFPIHANNKESINLFISETYQPLNIKIEQNGQIINEISIVSYKKGLLIKDDVFRFNKSQYPNVEMIDLR